LPRFKRERLELAAARKSSADVFEGAAARADSLIQSLSHDPPGVLATLAEWRAFTLKHILSEELK
jgi:hypothetical protein